MELKGNFLHTENYSVTTLQKIMLAALLQCYCELHVFSQIIMMVVILY